MQTRRQFLKFLGKAAAVVGVVAVAPKTALSKIVPKPVQFTVEGVVAGDRVLLEPRRASVVRHTILDGPRERFAKSGAEALGHDIDKAFIEQFERDVIAAYKQRGSLLR